MVNVEGARAQCRHDLLSAVVLEHMSTAVRALVHRFVAETLETESDATHSVSLMWESAEHWLHAADSQRAIELLRRCGNYLMDVGMPDEAAGVLERAESLAIAVNQRYMIGAERARALMRAERSRDAAVVLEDLLRLRQTIYPLPSPLDEVGIMSFEARWQNGESVPELASDCLEALRSRNASSGECVSAATWLAQAADNMCDSALGQRIYERIASHISADDVALDSRLQFLMVYHCCSGDGRIAVDLAKELAEFARRRSPPTVAIRYLRHAAHVSRCHGDSTEALKLAEESYRIAARCDSGRALTSSAYIVASICMQIGDNESASLWIERATGSYAPGHLTVMDVNLWSYMTELALRKGDLDGAEQFLANCLPSAARSKSTRSHARAISLTTQLRVLKGERSTDEQIQQLLSVFDVVKNATLQDYTMESIVVGLLSAGRNRDAAILADDYVATHRRDRSALAVPLARRLHDMSVF